MHGADAMPTGGNVNTLILGLAPNVWAILFNLSSSTSSSVIIP